MGSIGGSGSGPNKFRQVCLFVGFQHAPQTALFQGDGAPKKKRSPSQRELIAFEILFERTAQKGSRTDMIENSRGSFILSGGITGTIHDDRPSPPICFFFSELSLTTKRPAQGTWGVSASHHAARFHRRPPPCGRRGIFRGGYVGSGPKKKPGKNPEK